MADLRALTVAFLLFPLAAAAQESASNENTATDLTFPAVSNASKGPMMRIMQVSGAVSLVKFVGWSGF